MESHHEIYLLGISLAIGLLIGVERGWKGRGSNEGERVAGIRTYGLVGLLGGVVGLISQKTHIMLLGLVFIALAAILITAYIVKLGRERDVGITSLIASLLTFAFGALVALDFVTEAAAAAVVTTLLLGLKPVLHRWLQDLESVELRAGLKLLLISVVVLPILPNEGFGPWQALNPYAIWWMVVLISTISFAGYFAIKITGAKKGVMFTGLLAGLGSSTALTLHYSRLARTNKLTAGILATGILLACGTMFPRILLVTYIINPELFLSLLLPVVLMSVVIYIPAGIFWFIQRESIEPVPAVLNNPLELKAAVSFGALLALIMLLAAALKAKAGETGIYLLSALSGITDVDAITLSLAHGEHPIEIAVIGIVIASAVNSIVKGLLALGVGGLKLGIRVAAPLIGAAFIGAAVIWL